MQLICVWVSFLSVRLSFRGRETDSEKFCAPWSRDAGPWEGTLPRKGWFLVEHSPPPLSRATAPQKVLKNMLNEKMNETKDHDCVRLLFPQLWLSQFCSSVLIPLQVLWSVPLNPLLPLAMPTSALCGWKNRTHVSLITQPSITKCKWLFYVNN